MSSMAQFASQVTPKNMKEYRTIRLPKELLDKVEKKLVGRFGFTSIADVAKDGMRRSLWTYAGEPLTEESES